MGVYVQCRMDFFNTYVYDELARIHPYTWLEYKKDNERLLRVIKVKETIKDHAYDLYCNPKITTNILYDIDECIESIESRYTICLEEINTWCKMVPKYQKYGKNMDLTERMYWKEKIKVWFKVNMFSSFESAFIDIKDSLEPVLKSLWELKWNEDTFSFYAALDHLEELF